MSTVNGVEGAASTAASAASAPTRPNVSATSRSTGKPEKAAPSGSDEIACSARPWRVRSSVQAAAPARTAASAITKKDLTWMLAPASETTPSRPTSSNGSGSGNT